MNDLICPRCGEEWDADELHDAPNMSYQTAVRQFQANGCRTFGIRCAVHRENPRIVAAAGSENGKRTMTAGA